jgi:hypothetical protein
MKTIPTFEPFTVIPITAQHAIRVDMAKSTLTWLHSLKIYNNKEINTLTQMLDSPDWDNANLAVELIKTRLDGDSI